MVNKDVYIYLAFSCFFSLSSYSATVAPIGVKFCMMVHVGPRQVFSPLGAMPQGIPEILSLNFGHLTANILKRVNRSVTCQLQLNISSMTAF